MSVAAPPGEPDGDGLGVADRPVDHAGARVLVRGGFRGDADAATARDDVEPVVDVVRLLDGRAPVGRPQLRSGGAGAAVDEQDPRGQVGEICVRSPGAAAEYWRNPAATAEIFQDGWLHTGDLGRVNEHGHLTIEGRLKDMVRTAGENVYAKEVENAVVSHPQVRDCAVVGREDPEYGERVVAAVVLHGEADLTTAELLQHVRAQIAGFKVPREVHFLDELPKTTAGKNDKRALRAVLGLDATDATR